MRGCLRSGLISYSPLLNRSEHIESSVMPRRIVLEPLLEEQALLLNPRQRRALARVYERWAHQLLISAAILEADERRPKRHPLRRLPARKLALN